MKRNGMAQWQGDLKDGHGTLSTDSGALSNTPYSFQTRFADGSGTNPEELIGAAHAGCFSQALSMILGEAGLTPESIETRAAVTLEEAEGGFAITAVHLTTEARVPSASEQQFNECAEQAKAGCPVSQLLNAEITLEARLRT